MDGRINKVVILGGGTAGWMAAAYLSKALQQTVEVTVLEAPTIPRIGVGEATVPNLQRVVFDYLGIPEDEWMRECNASFKMAVKFINWRTPGPGVPTAREWQGRPDHFYHPFGILPAHDQIPLSHYWAYRHHHGETDTPFDYACFPEPAIMDANLAPRFRDGQRAANYAWHFDAALVADFLRRFAVGKQGVKHVADEMTEVVRDARGYLTALKTRGGRTLDGDLFIDCSGFRGLLINEAMAEPFVDMSDHLFCDSAVATSVPHDDENGVEPYTSAIAMPAGWAWKIPLLGRFGSGYVFASRFTERDRATEDFLRLWDLPAGTPLNQIKFRVGRNRRAWVKNCVSIGLASCFVEPLESTGIYFSYAAINQLASHFPDRGFDPVIVDRFNQRIEAMFDDTRDFLQAHFALAPRTDTPFWRAVKELTLPEQIREKIAMFRAGLPINPPTSDETAYYANFEAEFANFWTNGSYYSIFAGLGLRPDHPLPILDSKPESRQAALALFENVQRRQAELAETLPTVRQYLSDLHGKD